MKLLFTSIFLLAVSAVSVAQDKAHKNYYQAIDPIETDQYSFEISNSVSNYSYCKFAYKLNNLSTDFLVFKLEESNFEIDGKQFREEAKEIIIDPSKKKSGTFNASGDETFNYHHDNFSFNLDGIYLLPASGEVHEAPDFTLPASSNEITFGDFTVKLSKVKQETKETAAVFEVTYKGSDYALVDGSKLAVTVPAKGDKAFANAAKEDVQVLRKGDSVKINVKVEIPAKYADMQFADLHVVWKDTFQVSKLKKLEGGSADFAVDKALTDEKN